MKLCTVAVTAVFLCIIFCTFRNAVFVSQQLEQRVQNEFLSYSAKRFIAQSFKNTCSGKGFKSFEQWQLTCNALFKLDSIAFEKSTNGSIVYASWNGTGNFSKCSGEVYCKIQSGDNL